MRITKLEAINIRGRDIVLDLAPLQLVIGPNGSGKSTILTALDLAIQGYSKPLGGKADAALALFDTGRMTVNVEFDEDINIDRAWSRKEGKVGAVSCEQELRLQGVSGAGKGVRDREAAIRHALGVVPAALDLSELMDLTTSQKRALLFGFVDLAALKLDRAGVVDAVRQRVLQGVESDEHREAVTRQLQALAKAWPLKASLEDGLAELQRWTEEAWKGTRAAFDEARKTCSGAEDLQAHGGARDAKAIGVSIETQEERLRTVREALAVDAERRRSIGARQHRIAQAQDEIRTLAIPGPGESKTGLRADLDRLRLALEAVGTVGDGAVESARGALSERGQELATAEATLLVTKRRIIGLEDSLRRLSTLKGGICEHCQRPVSGDEADALAVSLQVQIDETTNEAAAGVDAVGVAADARRMAQGEVSRITNTIASRQRIEADIERGKAALDRCDASRKARTDKLQTRQAELTRLQQEDTEAAPVADVDGLAAEQADIEAALSALRGDLAVAQKAHAAQQLQAGARVRVLDLEHEVAALTEIRTALGTKGIQGEMLAALTGPLTTAANALLEEVGDYRLGVRLADDKGAPDLDLGWDAPGGLIGWRQLSTGQRAIFGAAIVVALLGLARPALRLLKVDNVECLDGDNAPRFLAALASMVTAGRLDQAIVCGVSVGCAVPDDWDAMDTADCVTARAAGVATAVGTETEG